MKISSRPRSLAFALVFASVALLSACQKNVEKKRMDEAATWATAMCDCAKKTGAEAKSCADALPEPKDPGSEMGVGGAPKYKVDSLKAYIDIISPGQDCHRKIQLQSP